MRAKITPNSWYRCLERGCALVRGNPEHSSYRRPGIPRLTVYHIPSFEDANGWTIRELPRGAGFELQSIVWHQRADADRTERLMQGEVISQPDEPTMSSVVVPMDAEEWNRRYEALRVIEIPLIPEQSMGLDGETFGLRVSGRIDVEWWCEGPSAWAALSGWTTRAITYFRTLTP